MTTDTPQPAIAPAASAVSPAAVPPNVTSAWPWVDLSPSFVPPPPPTSAGWPSISIVTPSYNHAHLVERTMRSVLCQGYPGLQYVVLDDGSRDDSADVIRKYESRLAHWEQHANCGQYATINQGMSMATGEILAWLNSDDMYLPWTLWAVGRIFATMPQVDWIVGHPAWFQDGTVHRAGKASVYPRDLIRAGLFYGGPGGLGWIQQEPMFWRRRLWEAAGPLRTELGLAADYEMNVRFARRADLYAVSTLLGGYGFQGGGQNRSFAGRDRYLAEVAKVRAEIRADPTEPAAARAGARRVEQYVKVKRVPVVRGLARRALRLGRLTGPVLEWDFDARAYRVERRHLFS